MASPLVDPDTHDKDRRLKGDAMTTTNDGRPVASLEPTLRADGVWTRRDGEEWWQTLPRVTEWTNVGGCARCGRDGGWTVLGMDWCEDCAIVASFSLPPAPLTGLGFVFASCALVQWMRQRVEGAWIGRVP